MIDNKMHKLEKDDESLKTSVYFKRNSRFKIISKLSRFGLAFPGPVA